MPVVTLPIKIMMLILAGSFVIGPISADKKHTPSHEEMVQKHRDSMQLFWEDRKNELGLNDKELTEWFLRQPLEYPRNIRKEK